jgi:hypothetical protein
MSQPPRIGKTELIEATCKTCGANVWKWTAAEIHSSDGSKTLTMDLVEWHGEQLLSVHLCDALRLEDAGEI